jgi:hypothetical protein
MTMTTMPPHSGASALLVARARAAVAAAPAPAATGPAPRGPAFALSATGAGGAIHLRAKPGRVLHGAVVVRNLSGRTVTVRLQPAAISNASNGNASYVTTRRVGAGRWLRLATGAVQLRPKAARRVAFSIAVPAGARGASYYAGIVAVNAAEVAAAAHPKTRKGTGFSFSRISRQALPITIRLPGPLTRRLTLRSVKLDVQPVGAGLMLGLLPKGTVLMQDAKVKLRVSRGKRTILRNASTLGQLFPDSKLDYRIAWNGLPTKGSYRVKGVIRPRGAKPIFIDRMINFTPATAKELKRVMPPAAAQPEPAAPGLPMWVWLALTSAAVLLTVLAFAFWRFARRSRQPVEPPPLRATAPQPDADEQDDRYHRTAA